MLSPVASASLCDDLARAAVAQRDTDVAVQHLLLTEAFLLLQSKARAHAPTPTLAYVFSSDRVGEVGTQLLALGSHGPTATGAAPGVLDPVEAMAANLETKNLERLRGSVASELAGTMPRRLALCRGGG